MESDLENLLDGSFPTPEEKKAARQNYLKRKSAERRRKIRAKRETDEAAALAADFADDSDVELPPIHHPMHASDSIKSGRSSSDESDCITVQSPPPHVPADTLQLWLSSDEEAVQQIDEICEFGIDRGYSSCILNNSSDDESVFGAPVKPDDPDTLWDDLRAAVNVTNMNSIQVDAVLAVFHKHVNLTGELPKSSKTLCRATHTVFPCDIKNISGHEYCYLGLKRQIEFCLGLYCESYLQKVDVLKITVNNDGLPLFHSNNMSAWPILVRIANLRPSKVFPVVLTAGPGKPHDLQYLEEFTSEAKHLIDTGLDFHGKHFFIVVNAVVCDAPARAHVKNVKQYSATFGCDQCESMGFYDGQRMTWPRTWQLPLRTDASFRAKSQREHHKSDDSDSPFLRLGIDMIKAFPPDFMHQGGGCMKKLLMWNISGPKRAGTKNLMCRISASNLAKLNKRMIQLREYIPNCFSRKPRTFHEIAYFKATELRLLNLYIGKVVFKGLMATDQHYEHLITYNCAAALLVDENTAQPYYELNQTLMKMFVDGCEELYGSSFVVYNIHSQLHFPDVAKVHGSIENVSSYCFENYLGQIKKMVKSSHRPIVSMVKGIERKQAAECDMQNLITPDKIFTKAPNNIYINVNGNGQCYQVIGFRGEWVRCIEYLEIGPFFTKPVDSRRIGCYRARSDKYRYVTLTAVQIRKCRRGMRIDLWKLEGMSIPENANISLFMSLLHDTEKSLYC